MDALREYSPSLSDEDVGNHSKNGGKPTIAPASSTSERRVPDDRSPSDSKSSSSPSPDHHSRRKRESPLRHDCRRSRSPHPHQKRSRSPPSRHRRRSRSPPSRRDSKGGGSYRPRKRSPDGSGRSHDRHKRRDTSDYRHSEDNRYKKTSERRDHTHHDPPPAPSRAPTWSTDVSLTPEQKLEQALATSNKPQQAAAAVGLPKYINPSVINPHHFKAVQEKKKLLWGKKKEKQQDPLSAGSWNKWESASFEGDDKGETQMKFRKLMGIKDGGSNEGGTPGSDNKSNKLLDNLEAQYEASRFMTHLAKGAGLGYGSNALITQNKVNPNDTDDINESSHHR